MPEKPGRGDALRECMFRPRKGQRQWRNTGSGGDLRGNVRECFAHPDLRDEHRQGHRQGHRVALRTGGVTGGPPFLQGTEPRLQLVEGAVQGGIHHHHFAIFEPITHIGNAAVFLLAGLGAYFYYKKRNPLYAKKGLFLFLSVF